MVFKKIKNLFSKDTDSYQDEFDDTNNDFANEFNEIGDDQLEANEVPQNSEQVQDDSNNEINDRDLISKTLEEENAQNHEVNNQADDHTVDVESEKEKENDVSYDQENSAFSNDEDISPFQRDPSDQDDNDIGSDSDDYDLMNLNQEENKPKETLKERHVTFVDTQEYMEVPTLADMVQRKKDQLTEEALMKRLNVSTVDSEQLDPLEIKKVNYAQKRLYSSEAQATIQNYLDRLDTLVENTQLNLSERHGKALRENFEDRALDSIEGILNSYDTEMQNRIKEYKADREEEYAKREQALKEQHQKEIEALKSQLETKFHQFKQEQEPVKRQEIELYQLEQEEKTEHKKKKALIDETYRQEQAEATDLIKYKSEILENSTKRFKDVSEEEQNEINALLKTITQEIDEKISDWSVEVTEEAKRDLEQQRYQDEKERQDKLLEAESEKIRLELQQKKEELENEKLQLERDNQLKEKELELKIKELKHEMTAKNNDNDEYKQLLIELIKNSHGQPQPMPYPPYYPPTQPGTQEGVDSSKKDDANQEEQTDKKMFWGIFLVGLVLSGLLLANIYFQNRPSTFEQAPQQQATVADVIQGSDQQVDEVDVLDRLNLIEEQLDELLENQSENDNEGETDSNDEAETDSESESASEELSLSEDTENFINANDFDSVMESLGDNPTDDLLNRVSDVYRHDRAIYELLALNATHNYLYSDYDQAILRDDIHRVHALLLNPEYRQFQNNGHHRLDDTLTMLYDHNYFTFSKALIDNIEGD